MKRLIAVFSFILFFFALTPLHATTNTSVYSATYPSTQGYYSNLTVNQVLTVGNLLSLGSQSAAATCNAGQAYFINSNGTLEMCDSGGLRPIDLWTTTGTYVTPISSYPNVCIGGTCSGANSLDVLGGAGISGGLTADTITVNSGGGTALTVNDEGAPVLTLVNETSSGSTLTVNGSIMAGPTTVQGTLQVNAGTTIGSSSVGGGSLTVYGPATVTGNTTVKGTFSVTPGNVIWLCSGSGSTSSCGSLSLTCTDGYCYTNAVYD